MGKIVERELGVHAVSDAPLPEEILREFEGR